jgi:hypothetical protein
MTDPPGADHERPSDRDADAESTRTAAFSGSAATSIGPYRLLQRIGEGGTGEVWLAEQTEPVRRRVALKLIKAGRDTKQVVARFEAERQTLAMMDHPCPAAAPPHLRAARGNASRSARRRCAPSASPERPDVDGFAPCSTIGRGCRRGAESPVAAAGVAPTPAPQRNRCTDSKKRPAEEVPMRSGSSPFSIPGAAATMTLACALFAASAFGQEFDELTPAAATTVKALFPAATVMGVGQESEQGVSYFEVAVRDGDRRVELEVTADGAVGEIESVWSIADVPQAARDQILRNTRGTDVKQVQRHEVRGVPRNGTFAPVDPPVVLYEAEYEDNGRRREFVVAEDGSPPPFEEEPDDDDDLAEQEQDDD